MSVKVSKLNQVAGSGKTTGLIKLIEKNNNKKILFLTFSKIAIEDFERRLKKNNIDTTNITFATIHALAVRSLQKIENFEVMSGNDQAIPVVARKMGLKFKPLIDFSSMYINKSFKQIESELKIKKNRHDIIWDELTSIYEDYKKYSFNYIMYKFNEIFDNFNYDFDYDVLMVDEAQDLSNIQIEVIKKIINTNKDLEVHIVGDILQNIYKFRFSGPKLLTEKLTENEVVSTKATTYRCSNIVIEKANKLIDVYYDTEKKQNKFKVNIEKYRDVEGTYKLIKNKENAKPEISTLILNSIKNKTTLGILVRNNYQIRDIIPLITDDIAKNTFIKENSIFNGTSVYLFNEIRKVKKMISVSKLTLDHVKKMLLPAQIYSFKKQSELFNLIKNGLSNISTSNRVWKIYINTLESYTPHTFKDFVKNFSELAREAEMYKHNASDTEAFLSFLNATDNETIYENKVKMAGRLRNKLNKNQNIIITTIHSSKGMEFDDVVLYGMDYNIKDYIEEVKLLYVGVTRAKNNILQVGENELSSILI